MQTQYIIQQLAANAAVFETMLRGISKEVNEWKPAPDKWCLLQVVCHLYDEELDDFRPRLTHVLEKPAEPLPPSNPLAWVEDRQYMQQHYETMLSKFIAERKKTIDWLQSLKNPKWDNAFQHPQYGPLRARMFLINWLAHDYLHLRQITRLKYDYLKKHSSESLLYAGDIWE